MEKAKAKKDEAAPLRVQPKRICKTAEYKERQRVLSERENRVLNPPLKPKAKGVTINFRKEVLAAFKTLSGNVAAVETIARAVAKSLDKKPKQVRARCILALRRLADREKLAITPKGRYRLVKKKKAARIVVKKKKVTARKSMAAAGAKKKKKPVSKTTKSKAAAAAKKKKKKPATKSKAKGTPKRKTATKLSAEKPPAKRTKKAIPFEGEGIVPLEEGAEGPRWEFFDRVWRPYDNKASAVVEAAFQEYLHDPGMLDVRAVHSGSWTYQVDFLTMKQTNIEHSNHTVRDIRRNPPATDVPAAK